MGEIVLGFSSGFILMYMISQKLKQKVEYDKLMDNNQG